MRTPGARLPIFFLVSLTCLRAQSGSLSGKVTDPSGAAMPAVTITLRNPASGAQRNTVTGEDGSYTLADFQTGAYDIAIDCPNFLPYRQTAYGVHPGAQTLDIR